MNGVSKEESEVPLMIVYKKLIYITSVISFMCTVILYYVSTYSELDFWINLCLGIFNSTALTVVTSIVFYNYEKRKTLESFYYHTNQILWYLSRYEKNKSLEWKINFFLDYRKMDKMKWDMDFGSMDFFFENITKNRKYIYDNIYKPICDFNRVVTGYEHKFQWHLDGNGRNDKVMSFFVERLEEHLLKIEGTVIAPKLVGEIQKELDERYYRILYGKGREK